MKRMTALICSLAMMAGTASVIGHAENEGFALGSDGVVYSLEMYTVDTEVEPRIGEAEIDSVWLANAMGIFPDAKFAVEIHPYVLPEGFTSEEAEFMEEHFIDGQSYAEFKKEYFAIDAEDRTADEKETWLKIQNENWNYVKSLLDNQSKHEAEWLTKNGIEVVNSDRIYTYYAVVSKEQLENFPVSTTTGYKVFLTRAENIPGAKHDAESVVTGKMLFGDFNSDGEVNSSDAADILIYSSAAGAGKASALDTEAETASDVNGDGTIDASDAAVILQYSAEVGSGNDVGTLEEYVSR